MAGWTVGAKALSALCGELASHLLQFFLHMNLNLKRQTWVEKPERLQEYIRRIATRIACTMLTLTLPCLPYTGCGRDSSCMPVRYGDEVSL